MSSPDTLIPGISAPALSMTQPGWSPSRWRPPRFLQRLHLRPARTLRVIAWMDEEAGGAGSKAYSAEYFAMTSPTTLPRSRATPAPPIRLVSKVKAVPGAIGALHPVQSVLQSVGATVLEPTAFPPGADIAAMSEAGVPAFGVMQDGRTYFNYHHTAADTLDKIVPHELKENAAAMAVMAYALTNMKEPLPR